MPAPKNIFFAGVLFTENTTPALVLTKVITTFIKTEVCVRFITTIYIAAQFGINT